MRIVQFKAENVKKLRVVEITPDGSTVVIGGMNEQGKSSILDSIMAALGGQKYIPKEAVRSGEKKGYVELDLGDLLVKRTFTAAGGGTLVVSNKDGAKYQSPQTMLDKLVGKISFDPLAFTRMDAKEQVEVLKNILDIDFEELDDERGKIYSERTEINRDVKGLKSKIAKLEEDLPEGVDIPKEELSVSKLVQQLRDAQDGNKDNEQQRNRLNELKQLVKDKKQTVQGLREQIDELNAEISEIVKEGKQLKKTVAGLKDVDEDSIQEQITNAEALNKAYWAGSNLETAKSELRELLKKSTAHTTRLERIEEAKQKAIADADLPIQGLTFDEDGIRFNDLPFEQASDAQRLKISVALGIAMNPKLKVLLIKDGSLLDKKNLKIIAKMADKRGAQIWIERVGAGDEMSVIMEDGCAKLD